jgi:hypothetical protein
MKRYLIVGIILSVCSSICFAFTPGGNFIVNNNSSFEMNRIDMQSIQMNKWNFPQTIPANQSTTSPIEFEWSWFSDPKNDSGTVSYKINCSTGTQIIKINAIVHEVHGIRLPDYIASFPIQSSGVNCVKTNYITDSENILLPYVNNVVLTVLDNK